MVEPLNDAQQAIADEIGAELFVEITQAFGQRWSADEEIEPSAAPLMRELARLRYAIPVGMGAMLAMARYAWEMAPPGSSAAMLVGHMTATAHAAAVAVLADGGEAGGFWREVAKAEEAADGCVT